MKILSMITLAFAACASVATCAEAVSAAPTGAEKGAVAKAAEELTLLNGSVNPTAQVYYYLQSASWCGPCKAAMPGIVDTYETMKADGRAEIILVSYDRTEDAAKKYIGSYNSDMPTVWAKDSKIMKMPGFVRATGIPFVIVVDADGKVLGQGAPGRIHQWKTLVK